MRSALLSDDPAIRGAAFEAAVLAALEIDPLEIEIDRLAAAYRWLSEILNEDSERPSSTLPVTGAGFDDRDAAAVFGLVYAARTFHAAHRLLEAYPPGEGTIVELGAGWGPFALRAGLEQPRPSTLVDASVDALARAERLFERSGASIPQKVCGDLSRFRAAESVGGLALPFVLNELPDRDDPSALRRQVERWAEMLSPTGRLYLLEPGTPKAARRLQRLRSELPDGLHIHAPCTGATTCPLLDRPTDWCHFTWRSAEGPLARMVADRARRRWQEQHLSFLILGRRSAPMDGALRVLDVRPHGHAKVVARACSREGLIPITALRRHPAHAALSALEPGSLLRVSSAELKGDGLRIVEAESLELLAEV